jgi:hypothetical protein
MNKLLAYLLGASVVGAGLYFILQGTESAHLTLTGTVLKVRVLQVSANASLVVADFRVTNPSRVPFVVQTVELVLRPLAGPPVSGTPISKPQMDAVFQGLRLLGPKYNQILGMQDRVAPGATVDRMAAARLELPAAAVDARQSLILRIEDVDGAAAEIGETAPPRSN